MLQLQGASLILQKTVDRGYGLDRNVSSKVVTLDSGETVTESWTYDDHWVASHQVVSSAAPSKLFHEEYTFNRDAQSRPIQLASVKRKRDDGSFETTSFAYDANGQVAHQPHRLGLELRLELPALPHRNSFPRSIVLRSEKSPRKRGNSRLGIGE